MTWVSAEIWYEALASEYGIVVKTSDPIRTWERLVALRNKLNDEDLNQIEIKVSPTSETELWLIKRTRDAT